MMVKYIGILVAVFFLIGAGACGFCFADGLSISDDVEESLERLEIYLQTEMYPEAAILLDQLQFQFPNEIRFVYLKAIVDYQRGNYESAILIFNELVEQHPQLAEAYYLLGQIYLHRGRPGLAREYLAKYCELVPEDYAAHLQLTSISKQKDPIVIIENGRGDSALVKKIGFYGACIHSYQKQSLKLINGLSPNWASMGIDLAYPLNLQRKRIVLQMRGKQGEERLQLTLRDKFAENYQPQLVLTLEQPLLSDWQEFQVSLPEEQPEIDLSQIVHIGLEFGSSTIQNPAHSTLFVQDIFIEDADD
jgi:tetratricopeptide (TPR) repeat protein